MKYLYILTNSTRFIFYYLGVFYNNSVLHILLTICMGFFFFLGKASNVLFISMSFITFITLICFIFVLTVPKSQNYLVMSIVTKLNLQLISLFLLFSLRSSYLWDTHSGALELNLGWIFFNSPVVFKMDFLSYLFIFLTFILIYLCNINNFHFYKKPEDFKYVTLLFLVIQMGLVIVFLSTNLLIFFLFFEVIVLPVFILIAKYGSRSRKVIAGYQFFFFTLAGSIALLFAIFLILTEVGSLDFDLMKKYNFDPSTGQLIWILCFLGFAVKVPVMPFHLWLPEAHVEAPTTGSVLLAGVLLKLGTYGFVRILIMVLSGYGDSFFPYINTLFLISFLYGCLITLRQSDLKKIIAYSSIVHMNFSLLGLFSNTNIGVVGAIFSMLSHGFVSAGLFFIVGMVYKRFGSRNIYELGGLAQLLPVASVFLFLLTLANMSFPLTSSFIGEIFIMMGLVESNLFIAISSGLISILAAVYAIWFFNRISFNKLNTYSIRKYKDLEYDEFFVLIILVICIFYLGIHPANILHFLQLLFPNLI